MPLLNRALRGAYPPGSTVKPLYALAAQHYGILTPQQVEYCPGYFTLPGSSNKYRDDKVHRIVGYAARHLRVLRRVFLSARRQDGHRSHARIHECLRLRRIDRNRYSGEKPGLYASPEWKRRVFKRKADQVWFPGETISMGIGQGPITVTPLQQAHFAAEIAERGKIIATPRLVAATRAPGSVTVVPRNPTLHETGRSWHRRAVERDLRRHGLARSRNRAAPPMRPFVGARNTSWPAKPAPPRW